MAGTALDEVRLFARSGAVPESLNEAGLINAIPRYCRRSVYRG
jgi:hypothetical protein